MSGQFPLYDLDHIHECSASELRQPFITYLDTKDTTNGLLEILQTCKAWEPYGCPLKLLVGCEEHAKFIPVLHKHLNEGLEWLSPS